MSCGRWRGSLQLLPRLLNLSVRLYLSEWEYGVECNASRAMPCLTWALLVSARYGEKLRHRLFFSVVFFAVYSNNALRIQNRDGACKHASEWELSLHVNLKSAAYRVGSREFQGSLAEFQGVPTESKKNDFVWNTIHIYHSGRISE